MSCPVCDHPKHREIDQALVAGSATLDALSREHGLSPSALERHQAHLQAKISGAQDRLRDHLQQSSLFWLSQALEITEHIAQAARFEGDYKVSLQAVNQGARLLKILQKQDLPLDAELTYDVLTSPRWAAETGLLPHDPGIMTRRRQSLAEAFAAPCPETDAAPPPPVPPGKPDSGQTLSADPAAAAPGVPPRSLSPAEPKPGQPQPAFGQPAAKDWELSDYDDDILDDPELAEMDKKIAQLDLAALARDLPFDLAVAKFDGILDELYDYMEIPREKPLSEYLHEQSLDAAAGQKTGPSPPSRSAAGQGKGT